MNKSDEVSLELAKNKADEKLIKEELEKAKKEFINKLQNGFGEDIKTVDFSQLNQCYKIKKNFGWRIKQFLEKLKKVCGF